MNTNEACALAPEGRAKEGVRAATLVAIRADGRLDLRGQSPGRGVSPRCEGDRTEPVVARLAHIGGYRPTVGDRLLCASDGTQTYVIAVLHPGEPLALEARDGARAESRDGALELHDAEGRLLVRYADGTTTISSPGRDLEIVAPGQVRIRALDVHLEAARDVVQSGARQVVLDVAGQQRLEMSGARTHLLASKLHVDAKETRLASGTATVLARNLSTTAERMATHVDHYELTARRLVEKAHDAFRTARGLAQLLAGRHKVIVEDTSSQRARRTVIVSKDETSIDGERVLLG